MSENKKARVIIRKACPRDCSYCCNKKPESLASAKFITNLKEVQGYNEIMITGGEPAEYLAGLMGAVLWLRVNNKDAKMYLYTAQMLGKSSQMYEALRMFDGVHYGVHRDFGQIPFDHTALEKMQDAVIVVKAGRNDFTARLWVEASCAKEVPLKPTVWDRIDVSPALDNCPLPEGEDLFILKEDLY